MPPPDPVTIATLSLNWSPHNPTGVSLIRRRGNRLCLEILLEAREPHLPADSGLLVAAERHVRRIPDAAVDVHGADAHPRGDARGALLVRREHRARQAIWRVVGDAHGVVVAVVRDHREHRAEDLLAGHLGVVVESR